MQWKKFIFVLNEIKSIILSLIFDQLEEFFIEEALLRKACNVDDWGVK